MTGTTTHNGDTSEQGSDQSLDDIVNGYVIEEYKDKVVIPFKATYPTPFENNAEWNHYEVVVEEKTYGGGYNVELHRREKGDGPSMSKLYLASDGVRSEAVSKAVEFIKAFKPWELDGHTGHQLPAYFLSKDHVTEKVMREVRE